MSKMIQDFIYSVVGKTNRLVNKIQFEKLKKESKVVVFNTALGTDNLGDHIIMKYCYDLLNSFGTKDGFVELSTHTVPSSEEIETIKKTNYKFVCGTNILTSHIEKWWNWRLPDGYRAKKDFRNVVLLGVGWGEYQDKCSSYSKLIYRTILNAKITHSVRDQYTEDKLREIGITNVLNTGCPTMWRLTPEFCKEIPSRKAENVITTITDYRRDCENDNLMLSILSRNYRTVYLWIQGKSDEEYMGTLEVPSNIVVIPRELSAYEKILKAGNVDYVGTRLHAGIFALNHKVRSLIVAVDNRAIEIAKDTNLPIVLREDVGKTLESQINKTQETKIVLRLDNIKKFTNQFV